MNIKSAVFGLISIKPQPISNVVKKLPYSSDSIYNVIEKMLKDGDIMKIKSQGTIKLDIPKNYTSQKLKEFYVKSLSYGNDPEILTRENSQKIWKALDTHNNVQDLMTVTNLSDKTVRKLLWIFSDCRLVEFEKKKPIIVKKVPNHPINNILDSMITNTKPPTRIYISGETPLKEIITTPPHIEKILYDKIDESLTIKKTGFLVKGKTKKISVLESIPAQQTLEEFFTHKLMTPEGVEDTCIKLLEYGDINYDVLLQLSLKKHIVNEVGCYLDIINSLKKGIIPNKSIKNFNAHVSRKKHVFLKDEMKFGKSGWGKKYEKKWNLDLYLDIGAIEHGVRAL